MKRLRTLTDHCQDFLNHTSHLIFNENVQSMDYLSRCFSSIFIYYCLSNTHRIHSHKRFAKCAGVKLEVIWKKKFFCIWMTSQSHWTEMPQQTKRLKILRANSLIMLRWFWTTMVIKFDFTFSIHHVQFRSKEF